MSNANEMQAGQELDALVALAANIDLKNHLPSRDITGRPFANSEWREWKPSTSIADAMEAMDCWQSLHNDNYFTIISPPGGFYYVKLLDSAVGVRSATKDRSLPLAISRAIASTVKP